MIQEEVADQPVVGSAHIDTELAQEQQVSMAPGNFPKIPHHQIEKTRCGRMGVEFSIALMRRCRPISLIGFME